MCDIYQIQEKILEIINQNPELDEIKPDQIDLDLSNIGMDSITFIRIVVELEETFNIEIPDEFLLIPEMNTVEKMMNIVLAATEMMSESISE